MNSMTGYGKGEAQAGNVALTVEIKTVNHRYADITVKLPRSLMALENDLRREVGQSLRRGKIDVFVNFGQAEESSVVPVLNRPLALAYRDLFTQLRNELGLSGGVTLELLAAQRDVIQLREADVAPEVLRGGVFQALAQAVDQLLAMRRAEGEATAADLRERLAQLDGLLAEVEQRAPAIPLEWQAKLTERLARLQQNFEWDPQRVAQESPSMPTVATSARNWCVSAATWGSSGPCSTMPSRSAGAWISWCRNSIARSTPWARSRTMPTSPGSSSP